MSRIKPNLYILPLEGCVAHIGLKTPYNVAFQAKLKEFPGAYYAGNDYGKGVWAYPSDEAARGYLERLVKAYGLKIADWPLVPGGAAPYSAKKAPKPKKLPPVRKCDVPDFLLPYQKLAVQRALKERRVLIAFDPGLGKTVTALTIADTAKCQRVLVVCPAIARAVWTAELLKWGLKGKVAECYTGKLALEAEAAENKPRWTIISHGLQPKIRATDYDCVIFDESHYLKNDNTGWWKNATRILSEQSLNTFRLLLTGTPITNEPIDFRAQGNLLYPLRYGWFNQFNERYALWEECEYAPSGRKYFGMNDHNEDELLERIHEIVDRVTADEVADIMPPLTTSVVRIKPKRKFKPREVYEAFTGDSNQHQQRMEQHAMKSSEGKVAFAQEWIADKFASGEKKVVLFTQLRATAKAIVACSPELATLVSGDVTAKHRGKIIEELRASEHAVAVCTIASVGVAIDLTFASSVLFVELPWTPGQLDQSFRRCYRLSSKHSLAVQLLVAAGSADELIIHTLSGRLKAFNKIQRGSESQKQLESALISNGETDSEFFDRLSILCEDANDTLSLTEGYF